MTFATGIPTGLVRIVRQLGLQIQIYAKERKN